MLSRDATFKRMEECISSWYTVLRCLKYSAIIIFFSDSSGNGTFLRENGGFLLRILKQES